MRRGWLLPIGLAWRTAELLRVAIQLIGRAPILLLLLHGRRRHAVSIRRCLLQLEVLLLLLHRRCMHHASKREGLRHGGLRQHVHLLQLWVRLHGRLLLLRLLLHMLLVLL